MSEVPLTAIDRLVREQIAATGPQPYAAVVELALYHPEHGFYSAGGSAGRRGDFLTSPEVGPLFGHLIAELIDREWERCGSPDEFVVVDAGAGPGTLARSVMAATPRCSAALRYVAVERSAAQRQLHPGGVESVETMPIGEFVGVVVANELLDNLTFTPLLEIDEGFREVVVGEREGRLVEMVALDDSLAGYIAAPVANRLIDQSAAADWLTRALDSIERGRLIVIDYARANSIDVEVRTYSEHERSGEVLERLGTRDITVDVDLEQLQRRVRPADSLSAQAEFLTELGIGALVEQGARIWDERAAIGDLAALRARSRVREAEALLDTTGLGDFTVAQWVVG